MAPGSEDAPYGAPGSAPHHTTAASIMVERFIPHEDLFEGLDDLFDQAKIDRVLQKAVQKMLGVIRQIMSELQTVAPEYSSKIAAIAATEEADFDQIAAEYLVQEMFFLQMAAHLDLEPGYILQDTPSGVFALTANHSLVSISSVSGEDPDSDRLLRAEMTYTPMPSRKTNGQGAVLSPRKYLNQPLQGCASQGAPCVMTSRGMKTSPLKMVFVIPSDIPFEVFQAATGSLRTSMGSTTATRLGPKKQADEDDARRFFRKQGARTEGRTSQAEILPRRNPDLDEVAPRIGESVLAWLRRSGLLPDEE